MLLGSGTYLVLPYPENKADAEDEALLEINISEPHNTNRAFLQLHTYYILMFNLY
jgi:hypothetical protein